MTQPQTVRAALAYRDTKLNKTLGVLANGVSVKKYGLAEMEGYLGGVPGYPGIGAKPYEVHRASFRQTHGAEQFLEALQGRGPKIGVLTNDLREVQLETLEAVGLPPHIDAPVTVSDAPPKPDPASYTACCEGLDVRADQAVMVGDDWHNDVAGAVRGPAGVLAQPGFKEGSSRGATLRPRWIPAAGTRARNPVAGDQNVT